MVNKIVYLKILSCILCLLLSVSVVACVYAIKAYAVTEETYILVATSKEANEIMDKYGKKQGGTQESETDTENDAMQDDAADEAAEVATQEIIALDEFLTISCVGTKTEKTEKSESGGEETGTTSEYTVQIFSIKHSKPASEWPAKLKTIRAIADKSNKGEFTARIAEEAPADNIKKIGFLVRSTMDRTGCFYMDADNNLYVYFTALSEDDAKSYIDTEEQTEHKAMEGQVDLRELSAEELADLTRIRDELVREQEHKLDTRLLSVADIILNIFGVLCILYAVVLLLAYVMDMYNIFSTELEFFNIVSFGRWHIADFADGGIIQDTSRFVKIPKLIFIVAVTALVGVLLLVVKWAAFAATIYTYLRER